MGIIINVNTPLLLSKGLRGVPPGPVFPGSLIRAWGREPMLVLVRMALAVTECTNNINTHFLLYIRDKSGPLIW